MINLIQADLYKMRKSNAIKILLLITAFCALVMALFAYLIPQGKIPETYTGLGFLFSDVNMMSILGAAAAGIFICGDFDNRTVHDAVTSGCSRIAIIGSKAVTFFITIIILLIPYAVFTVIGLLSGAEFNMGNTGVGFLHMLEINGGTDIDGSVFLKLLAVMLTLILAYAAQLSICIPFALKFKKPVVVNVVYYGLTLLFAQLYGLKNTSAVFDNIFSFTPYGGEHTFLTLDSTAGDIGKTILVCLIFITVMMVVTNYIFRKSEIK